MLLATFFQAERLAPLSLFKRLIPGGRVAANRSFVPEGERVYAIGDIHGRLDLLDDLLTRIDADDAARGPARTHLILLGDLIDRGPDSAGVVQRAIALKADRPDTHVLFGNHEEMLLTSLRSERNEAMKMFIRNGGDMTLMSYGISNADYLAASFEELRALAIEHVPAEHVAFLDALEPSVTIGDYLFVHAGIKPGVPLEEQRRSDLRWIRDEFLTSRVDHGFVVVHGHSIANEVEERPNRIGIDTGAYASDILTAIGLEGSNRWFFSTARGCE